MCHGKWGTGRRYGWLSQELGVSISSAELHAALTFTLECAQSAGTFLANRPDSLRVDTKTSSTDVVTHMDQGAEDIIVRAVNSTFPHDGILAEEGSVDDGKSGRRWVIDPLDGTVNYLYQLPFWAVSIALVDEVHNETLVGVVHAPALGFTYYASLGEGAWKMHQGKTTRLGVSTAESIGHSLIGTGFAYTVEARTQQARALSQVLPQVRDIRRLGSCALDLCAVAEGTLDGYFESGVQPWDCAAGSLIAKEAGAHISGFAGHEPNTDMVITSTPRIFSDLVALVTSAYDKE